VSQTVSIIVNNFNYGEFLGEAIESALAQTHRDSEVIVVDDGSTDGSRRVLDAYRERVRPVEKENNGQASAFNAGFRVARGEIVIFLDADDLLLPETAARVARIFRERPKTAKVHYRLRVIDQAGFPTGAFVPPVTRDLPDGDIASRVLAAPDDIPYPPTSGNAFAASVLRELLPMPEAEYRRLADVYLLNLAPLLGPVARLDEIGGCYRLHDRNVHFRAGLDLRSTRATIRATAATREHVTRLAASRGLRRPAGDPASVTDLAQRLVSRRLDPRAHPIARDRPLALAAAGIRAALARRDLAPAPRVLYAAWFAALAVSPARVARTLAERLVETWRVGSLRRP
jgi:hypothetical protein